MVSADFGGPIYPTFGRLVRVQTALWRAADAQLRHRHDIALADVTALQVVSETGGMRVQDLAATLHITVGGASKVIDRLVASDLVQRTPHPTDRRSSVVKATAAGRKLLQMTSAAVEDVLTERLEGVLGTEGVARLDNLLLTLEGAIEYSSEGTLP
jgi:MarR family multiple antibiotic resistance transcriptional regulator